MRFFINELKLYGTSEDLQKVISKIIDDEGLVDLSILTPSTELDTKDKRMNAWGCYEYEPDPSYVSEELTPIDDNRYLFELRFETTGDIPIQWLNIISNTFKNIDIECIGDCDDSNEVVEFYKFKSLQSKEKDYIRRTYFDDERDKSRYLTEVGYHNEDISLIYKYRQKIILTDFVIYKNQVYPIYDILSKSWDNIDLDKESIIEIDEVPTIVNNDDLKCVKYVKPTFNNIGIVRTDGACTVEEYRKYIKMMKNNVDKITNS